VAWKRFFTPVNTSGQLSPISSGSSRPSMSRSNYSSYLPDVYSGHPNRLERYGQYDSMDTDSEVNAAFDILAEFCTQINDENGTPFQVFFKEQATSTEIKIIKKYLQQWTKANKFHTRIFKIVRNCFKYGDVFFVRDPETQKWLYIDPSKVDKIIVNESEGKKPEQYIIRDLNVNLQTLTVTQINPTNTNVTPGGTAYLNSGAQQRGMVGAYPSNSNTSRFQQNVNQYTIDARHVIHISMSEGLDNNFPFGNSLMETIFKVYKQKELLEDAIIIYRVQRAPERRVFYIDVGNMPSHLAMGFVERVKNEINQRRIPSSVGGGQNVIDAAYNPLCLDLSTRIPLLDGRTLSLSELITEFNNGKENWAYSCDPVTGRVVPGLINWAGITRKNTETVKLTFDNGNTLICTPDHKIPVFGKGFIEAQHLTENDSLIAFNTRDHNIDGANTNKYQQVWDHEYKQWIYTHRMVGEFFKSKNKHQEFCYLPENANLSRDTIHHIDCNRFNNDPRNLTYMNKKDHILFHASKKKEFWENITPQYRAEMTGKIAETARNNWANMSEDQRTAALWNIRAAQKQAIWLRQNDPDVAAKYADSMRQARKEYFDRCPDGLAQVKKNMEKRVKIKNQPLNVTFDMLQCVADIVRSGEKNKNKVLALCDKNSHLLSLVQQENSTNLDHKNVQNKIDFTRFGYSKMDSLLSNFGYKNWKHFVREIANFNHRVVSIERVENRDTGTITIDGLERWHGYHTFAIEAGIFIKNSINEDYFFPQTSEGRGSKVEILPGGTNLGEIDDLRYFTNKLFRALRIPSSYLPTGPDDGGSSFNDGRVGTAYIQELRFNKYCERLQSLINDPFDIEFKLYLHNKGINVDNNLFDLRFNPPQNFAAYRQAEMDTARVSTFSSMVEVPFMSKRFAMKRFLGLTIEEIAENEKMWREENIDQGSTLGASTELRSAGITAGGILGDVDDLSNATTPPEDLETGEEDPDSVMPTSGDAAVPPM
jgi:intein/homing endonuclease